MKYALFFAASLALCACTSKTQVWEDAPIITSATYQHTQYNGRNQPVEASTAKQGTAPFIITYFQSEADRERGLNGSTEPPVEVGDYYVSIERPEGNGFRRGNTINIEYHVQKAFITIVAEPVQRFTYDGNPKPVAAFTDPPADPLTVTYADSATVLPAPPVNKGRYRATIVFPGNERYMGAAKEIALWIE